MHNQIMKIGVVAPSCRIEPSFAEKVKAVAERVYAGRAEIFFHPQCFLSSGHFAGADEARARAFLDVANDESFGALWFARGGYGACRIVGALEELRPAAKKKLYLGYSDAGFLLAGLYKRGFSVAHGPMASELRRQGGEAAVTRSLSYLVERASAGLEPSLSPGFPAAAFNITVLSQLLGTDLQPDLTDYVLMLEEVSEQMYRIDRALFHITSNPAIRKVKGIRLGRCSDILPNDPEFGTGEEDISKFWCRKSGIAYLGRADIGHDVENKIVPFGGI